MDLHDLRHSVELALEIADAETTVVAAEVCASWSEYQTVSVRYDADRPTDGVQEPQALTTFGVGILVVVEDREGHRVGFGSEADDLTQEGIFLALEKAKANAVATVGFDMLPGPPVVHEPSPVFYDPQVMSLPEDELQRLALEAFNGALAGGHEAGYVKALLIDGNVRSRKELLAIGNTQGLLATDTSTGLVAHLRTALSAAQSSGTGSSCATHLQEFAAFEAGAESARRALQARGGQSLAPGDYAVVFGPEAMAELWQDLLVPAFSLDAVMTGTSPLATRLGQQVASPLLTVRDAGRLPGCIGSRAITGEGLPTGSTVLLDHGCVAGFLADTYHAQRLAAQLGTIVPRNGMRHATNGQSFGMRPGIFPSNVTFSGSEEAPLETLLDSLRDGIYVGGLWYTYPQEGLYTGEFTSTVIGPSFRIRQGKLAEPLQPGTLRLHDNVLDLLQRVTGMTTTRHAVPLATMQSLVLAPAVRCSRARFVA